MATSTPHRSTFSRMGDRRRIAAVLGGTAAATVVWLIAAQVFGNTLVVRGISPGTTQEIGIAAVVITSIVAGAAAWALLALLERYSKRGRKIWTITAVAVLVLSTAGPVTQALTLSTQVTLVLMHLSVAAVLMLGLLRASASGPR